MIFSMVPAFFTLYSGQGRLFGTCRDKANDVGYELAAKVALMPGIWAFLT